MKEVVTRITTVDTKKTYEFPSESNPQLWAVEMSISHVDKHGYHREHGWSSKSMEIFVERATLEKAGLVSVTVTPENDEEIEKETAEGLILRLLEHVGVFPEA